MPLSRSEMQRVFDAAIDAYRDWRVGTPEPAILVELGDGPQEMTIGAVCELLQGDSDPISSVTQRALESAGITVQRNTFGDAALQLQRGIERRLASQRR